IDSYNGAIVVKSAPGKTVFKVTLPVEKRNI
ncbi:MAG: sensor histidine kinase, partial [Calditrichaeota bacterium]